MPARLESPKVRIRVNSVTLDEFIVYCPVCGHDDFVTHGSPSTPGVLEDAYYRALCMYRDHYPYGGSCQDWKFTINGPLY